ncbi:Helix-turn-helix domain-containing protein [Amycolatopsis arida]|uniref:Helix-turn-helix domain-containing protein n=2 Tax=Amycolatopsis arida TaxID=587909 RepID=A0A1I5WST2_9PSEU|nr:helix-turn-helix transcriptional regulator [Amycolatopsis arida]TDX92434.1 helix-turn-helix protein [Amycolatopsis arida]SFQ22799.1 Helix-turn-helix domain-containing protein [Amycolatopsis arida]
MTVVGIMRAAVPARRGRVELAGLVDREWAALAVRQLGETFAEFRRWQRRTQVEAVAGTGLSNSTLCRFEVGRRSLTLTQFVQVCAAIGAHPGEVFLWALPPTNPEPAPIDPATLVDLYSV